MRTVIKKIANRLLKKQREENVIQEIIDCYIAAGSVPWSTGYHEYKWQRISGAINNDTILKNFEQEQLPKGYGIGIDERVIEYPWLITHIPGGAGKLLDAGSTFNFKSILQHPLLQYKDIYIYTFYPEETNFIENRVSYIYGDLRELPFKNDYFDIVVCHSTLEHIAMDNSMYGYELGYHQDSNTKNFDYLKVISELERIAKPMGTILLSFPYGKFENHGFFQQFDTAMVQRIEKAVELTCTCEKSFARYQADGWGFASPIDCDDATSYNPHTGRGKGDDNAAHSRAICFMKIQKNKEAVS